MVFIIQEEEYSCMHWEISLITLNISNMGSQTPYVKSNIFIIRQSNILY